MEGFLDDIYLKKKPCMVALFLGLEAWFLMHGVLAYFPALSGAIPDDWSCVSSACEQAYREYQVGSRNSVDVTDALFPCQDTENRLTTFGRWESNTDFVWMNSNNKTSFAIDMDLACSSTKLKMLYSIYFLGALVGLLSSSLTIDYFGRRRTALGCATAVIVSSIVGANFTNYYLFLAIRFLQGAAKYAADTAIMVLLYENLPASKRNTAANLCNSIVGVSMAVLATIGYFVVQWQHYFWVNAILCCLLTIPIIASPESPRFFLLKGDFESAKDSLRRVANRAGVEDRSSDILRTRQVQKDLHPSAAREWNKVVFWENLASGLVFTFAGLAYYVLNFGWATIIPNPYLGYCLNGVAEMMGSNLLAYGAGKFGRRYIMTTGFTGATLFGLIALSDETIRNDWTINSVASLICKTFVMITYVGIYLWAAEIPPSTHLGFVYNLTLGFAIFTGFYAPPMFDIMERYVHSKSPLIVMICLFASGIVLSLCLPETEGVPRVETIDDVVRRRKAQQFTCRVMHNGGVQQTTVIMNESFTATDLTIKPSSINTNIQNLPITG